MSKLKNMSFKDPDNMLDNSRLSIHNLVKPASKNKIPLKSILVKKETNDESKFRNQHNEDQKKLKEIIITPPDRDEQV
jgi:hypothetical protein